MSAGFGEEVDSALSLIEDAKLSYPLGPLLESFILEALNPRLPARYILERCRLDDDHHVNLLEIVSNWKYIVGSSEFPSCGLSRFLILIHFSVYEHSSAPPPPNPVDQAAIRRRDGSRCCITGKLGHLWDPLIVVPILELPTGWSENEV